MVDNRSPEDEDHYSRDSPDYGVFSTEMFTTMGIASALMILTIVGMVLSADTALAEFGIQLYETFFLLGIAVFGVLLYIGRKLGMEGVQNENYGKGFLGSAVLVFAYSWFGGMVLTMYAVNLYGSILIYTSIITVLITLGALALVYGTDRDYEVMGKFSGLCFLIGLVFAVGGSFIQSIQMVTFAFFLLGFIFDLVYEVWMVSDGRRTPTANGIAVYVAFAGTFVHIMQLVAREL